MGIGARFYRLGEMALSQNEAPIAKSTTWLRMLAVALVVLLVRAALAFAYFVVAIYIGFYLLAGGGHGCITPARVFFSWGFLLARGSSCMYPALPAYLVGLFVLNTVLARFPSRIACSLPFLIHGSGAILLVLTLGEGDYCTLGLLAIGTVLSVSLTTGYLALDMKLARTRKLARGL